MEARLINIVWCDDKIDTLDNEVNQELFAQKNCCLYKKAKTSDELKNILNDYRQNVDAVIVDFNLGESSPIPGETSASGFRWIHEHFADYAPLPFYLFSAREAEFIEKKYADFEFSKEEDYFLAPNRNVMSKRNRHFGNGEFADLLDMAVEEVAKISTPEYVVRQKYAESFSALSKFDVDETVFLKILISDENVDRHELPNLANPLRSELENCIKKLDNDGITPGCALNVIPYLLSGQAKDSNNYSKTDYMHKSMAESFEFFLSYTQDGSHDKKNLKLEFRDYLKKSGDIYIVKALAIIGLDIIKWLGKFYDKYKERKPFPPFAPFSATAEKIITVKGKEGAIVHDNENKKYFVKQHPTNRYDVGTKIKITSRSATAPEFGDYFSLGENLDV
jgi:hypothetical protein